VLPHDIVTMTKEPNYSEPINVSHAAYSSQGWPFYKVMTKATSTQRDTTQAPKHVSYHKPTFLDVNKEIS
jgi:hypothetical protein